MQNYFNKLLQCVTTSFSYNRASTTLFTININQILLSITHIYPPSACSLNRMKNKVFHLHCTNIPSSTILHRNRWQLTTRSYKKSYIVKFIHQLIISRSTENNTEFKQIVATDWLATVGKPYLHLLLSLPVRHRHRCNAQIQPTIRTSMT